MRCFIARAMLPEVDAIVGLATETPGTAAHISWIATYFKPEVWPAHEQMFAHCLSRLSGMFADVQQWLTYEQEFPSIESVGPETAMTFVSRVATCNCRDAITLAMK